MSRDRQPEACAASADPRTIGLVETLEDARQIAPCNADAVIGDRGFEAAVACGADGNGHLAAVEAELHRVMKEVREHLAEPAPVAADPRHDRRDVERQPHALPLGERSEALDGIGGDGAEVDVVKEERRFAAFDAAEVQQLVNHLADVAGFDAQLGDPIAHPGRQRVARRFRVAFEGLGQ